MNVGASRSWIAAAMVALAGAASGSCAGQLEEYGTAVAAVDTQASIGRLTSFGNGRMRTVLQYDTVGHPVVMTQHLEGRSFAFTSTYGYERRAVTGTEIGSVLRSLTYPDGEVVSYTYDLGGAQQAIRSTPRNAAARDIVIKVIRNVRGDTVDLYTGDGTITSRRYNDVSGGARTDRRPRLEVTKLGTRVVQAFQYRFDAVGNLTEVGTFCAETTADCGTCDPLTSSCVLEKESACYRYDELDRLTQMTSGTRPGSGAFCAGTARAYAYDEIDNLITKDGQAQGYGFGAARPHAITSWPGVTLAGDSYDASGNMLRVPGKLDAIVWNADNLPVYESGPGGTTRRSYVGEKMWKRETSGSAAVYYLPGFRVEGTTYRKFYGEFAERESTDANAVGTLRFYHGDHLGSSTVATDATGAIAHRSSYLPFGEDRTQSGTFIPKYRFNFKEKHTLTGLYDYGARQYIPEIGRWLSPDSVRDGQNPYAYAQNNPLRWNDPTGHQTQTPQKYTDANMNLVEDAGGRRGFDVLVANMRMRCYAGECAPYVHTPLDTYTIDMGTTSVPHPNRVNGRDIPGYIQAELTLYRMGEITRGSAYRWMERIALAELTVLSFMPVMETAGPLGLGLNGDIAAMRTANSVQAAASRPGAAGALEVDGQVFTGVSGSAQGRPLHGAVEEAMEAIPVAERSPFHGMCAEPQCISRALEAGVNPSGGTSVVFKVRAPGNPGHNTLLPPCSSCRQLLKHFGIKGIE